MARRSLLWGERRPAGRKQGRGRRRGLRRRRVTDGSVKWTCVSSPPSGPQSGTGAASYRAALSGILTGWLMDPVCLLQRRRLLYLGAKEEGSPGCILLEACWRQGSRGFQDAGLPYLTPRDPGRPHLTRHSGCCGSETCPRPGIHRAHSLEHPSTVVPDCHPGCGLDLCPNASAHSALTSESHPCASSWEGTGGPLGPWALGLAGNRESVQAEICEHCQAAFRAQPARFRGTAELAPVLSGVPLL